MNYTPETVFEGGCQVIAMNFQYVGDHMKEYLSKFHEKSFILKPFEFTKYSDLPQRGYDPDKIAYYENYEILSEESDSAGNTSLSNDYNQDGNSIFFKNNIGYEKPNLKHGCCKIFLDEIDIKTAFPDSDINISMTNMIKKLHELGEKPDENYNNINEQNKEDIKKMIGYPGSDTQLGKIKYFILKKQLEKVFQRKREEIFKAGMKDPCHGLDDKCSTNPVCYNKPYDLKIKTNNGKKETLPLIIDVQMAELFTKNLILMF